MGPVDSVLAMLKEDADLMAKIASSVKLFPMKESMRSNHVMDLIFIKGTHRVLSLKLHDMKRFVVKLQELTCLV